MYTNKLIVYLKEFIKLNSSNTNKIKGTITAILTKLLINDKEMMKIEISRINNLKDNVFKNDKLIDKHIYFTIRPFKEPKLQDISDACKVLNVPLEEYIYYPDMNNIVTKTKVPVGYINIRFLNQVIEKGAAQSHKINDINASTGMLTNSSKIGQFSSDESLAMFSYGLEKEILPEFFNLRGDNLEARSSMFRTIVEEGNVDLDNISSTGYGQVQKTLDLHLLGAGLKTNLQEDYKVSIDGVRQDSRS